MFIEEHVGLEILFWPFLENIIYCRPVILKIVTILKAKRRQGNCSRLKEAKQT